MSELSEAINEMRNMRESYDQLADAAEAYNTGKAELAANITAKGVQASATETLPELAEKVAAISQDTYEINGGEMYAKQLFGSLETPNYWNLYEIMAQLLSDGRLVNYGGILLAEYYKGYDSLALSGAGAGGAYVVSDKDSDGNFIMYTEDTTHTWNDDTNFKGNRWVAYCFAYAGHDFEITNTNTSPRSIHIGRSVGTIRCLAATRISEIVCTDGNEFENFVGNDYAQNWQPNVIIRNVKNLTGLSFRTSQQFRCLDINAKESISGGIGAGTFGSVILSAPELKGSVLALSGNIEAKNVILQAEKIYNQFCLFVTLYGNFTGKKIIILDCEEIDLQSSNPIIYNMSTISYLYIGYKTNDRTRTINMGRGPASALVDVEIQDGWCKPLNVSQYTAIAEENIVNHILNKLGDNSGQPAITITLGATNLAKLTEEEKAIATNKGFTLA